MSDNKLRVGDTVIVKSCLYGHEFEIGQAVTIREIFEDYNSIDYDCIDQKGINWSLNEVEIGTSLDAQAPAMYNLLVEIDKSLTVLAESERLTTSLQDEIKAILAAARGETINQP